MRLALTFERELLDGFYSVRGIVANILDDSQKGDKLYI